MCGLVHCSYDENWQSDGVISKHVKNLAPYLQTWKVELTTTKPVAAFFQLHHKKARREVEVHLDGKSLTSANTIPRSSFGQNVHIQPTPRATSQKIDFPRRTSEAACWTWIGRYSRKATAQFTALPLIVVVHITASVIYRNHQGLAANFDWIPPPYTIIQSSGRHLAWIWPTITHFTLHCYRIDAWAIRCPWLTFVNALANSILGRFYTARTQRFASCSWPMVLRKLRNRWKWKGESWFHNRKVLFVGVVGIAEMWFCLV